MKKKKRLLLLLPAGAILALLIFQYLRHNSTNNQDIILISGNIEITEAELSFMIPGRVAKRLVSEGQTVVAGQVVAWLDSTELAQEVALRKAEVQAIEATLAELVAGSRPEEIAQARAFVQKAQSKLNELLTGSRPQEVAVARAAVNKTKAEAERLKREYERQDRLFKKSVISRREYEVAEAAYAVAKAKQQESEEQLKLVTEGPRKEQIEQAHEVLKEAQERLALVKKGPRQETIDQAKARLKQTQSALALAEIRLDYATLTSPLAGLVLSEAIEPGERVSPGTPVVTIGDLKKVWLRAYINETDLGRVKVGQIVKVTIDTYPDKVYEGKISFISPQAEFTPKNIQTQKERVKLVYRLKVDIPNPDLELKPGMPADGEIMVLN